MNLTRTLLILLATKLTLVLTASSLNFSYETGLNDEKKCLKSNSYRSRTHDSFRRTGNRGPSSESTIPIPLQDCEGQGDFFCVPLTIESLTKLQESHVTSPTSNCNELLQIKRSSSMKSLSGGNSDTATENWFAPLEQKIPLFVPPISEAPTESNSTATSSVNSTAQIPAGLKKVLDISRVTESLLEYLQPVDLVKLFVSNSALSKILRDHVRDSFNTEFPNLIGISKSAFRLLVLRKLLNDPQMKFKDWANKAHPLSAINLHLFINDRLMNATVADERFALVDLIEFVRANELTGHPEELPRPLNVFFTSESQSDSEFETKLRSVVMKAANHGHIRVLTALYRHIKASFQRDRAGLLILDLFLLGTETRQGIQWTALLRSILAPTTDVANFLFERVTGDEDVLKAHFAHMKLKNIQCDLPCFWERLMFPLMARQKLKRILQLEMVKAVAHKQVRAVHLAISRAKSPNVLSLFLSWERNLVPVDRSDVQVLHLLAHSSKSLQTLRLVKQFFPAIFPAVLAFKSDWPAGFKQFFRDRKGIRSYISKTDGFLHLLAYNGSVNILEYLCKEFLSRKDFLDLSETLDDGGKKPLQIALEREKWDMVKLLIRYGARHDKQLHARVLEVNPVVLNDILPDQHDREILAYCYTEINSHVTLLEWSILSKNHEALRWFLANLPLEYWRKFDGAGNTPIHLAVISGNSEAIKLMLNRDSSLLTALNYFNDTPMQVACRIRDKTRTQDKIDVIDEVIETLCIDFAHFIE